MASFTENQELIHHEFQTLKSLFTELKHNEFSASEAFTEISMGMSGDYHIAIEEGSTMIRLGSTLFGAR